MKNLDELPTPTELMDRPQLAVLAALETTLVAALRALLAVHPALLDDTFPRTILEEDLWAERLIYLGGQLETVLRKYLRALREHALMEGSTEPAF